MQIEAMGGNTTIWNESESEKSGLGQNPNNTNTLMGFFSFKSVAYSFLYTVVNHITLYL